MTPREFWALYEAVYGEEPGASDALTRDELEELIRQDEMRADRKAEGHGNDT